MVKIAPSLLSADFSNLPNQVRAVDQAGADWIHLDVMDGSFVPNITFGPIIVEGVRKLTQLPLDVHLMIEKADDFLKPFRDAGADHLTVHFEACPHLWRTLDFIIELGAKAGITLNPATPIRMIEPVLHKVSIVLLMSVEPGFGGQTFIPQTLESIAYLSKIRQERQLEFDIEVDGGVNLETAPQIIQAGANVLVAGNWIFNSKDPSMALQHLREAAAKRI